jgi:hypothetical protein
MRELVSESGHTEGVARGGEREIKLIEVDDERCSQPRSQCESQNRNGKRIADTTTRPALSRKL